MPTDEEIYKCFVDWFKKDTWSTTHPLDDERFNRCCYDAFQRKNLEIDADSFQELLTKIISEFHSSSEETVARDLERFASRLDTIHGYLCDTGQLGRKS